ncbi:MAG: D-alanyl-D-alanine carboxypeptidase family protein [Alphaproteobacteria bacterium]
MIHKALTSLLAGLFSLTIALPAMALDTPAKQALLYDLSTGTVLLDKNADQTMPPSSMSKLMTVLMVFDRLAEGSLSLDDKLVVSQKAWKKGGSKMFVMVDSQVRVEDLLRGIIVQSGNDACIVIAEGLAGSEEAFAAQMNDRAKELGLTGSHFANATGWPHPDHYVTAHDLGKIAEYLITEHKQFYAMFAEKEFEWAGIKQGNRNPVLYKNIGADGLKTGHTEAAGYGLTASAERDGRRVILVVNGLKSVRERTSESTRLLGWAFREFRNYSLFEAGESVREADIWLGQDTTVPLVVPQDLTLTLKRTARARMKVTAQYVAPIPAPVVEGQRVGTLTVTAPDMEPIELPLLAGKTVHQLGAVGRLKAAFNYLLWGASTN